VQIAAYVDAICGSLNGEPEKPPFGL